MQENEKVVGCDSLQDHEENAEIEQITMAPTIDDVDASGDCGETGDVFLAASPRPKEKIGKLVVSSSKLKKSIVSPSKAKMAPKLRTPHSESSPTTL